MWKKNQSLSLPGLNLPIKDIEKCSTETWRAISCVLQVKPCSRSKHATQICRDDCYDILSDCMDWTRMETRHTPESICSKFSIEDSPQTPCISLRPFLEPSDLPRHNIIDNHKITSPCKGHTCNTSEICVLTNKNDLDKSINDYRCAQACPLGETSSFMVPLGAYARIPVSLKQKGCFKVCKCGTSGRLENCQPLPCISLESCVLSDKKIEHGTWFHVECNICSCFAGEITCTKKQCRMPGISDHSYTSLPCNCPPHHVPVCGKNGQTYPSACISKCSGLQDGDIEFGACRTRDPCQDIKCPTFAECVENRGVCLSVMHKPCRQYQCSNYFFLLNQFKILILKILLFCLVNTTSNCPTSDRPVCTTDRRTMPSMCHLLKSKGTLAYRGRCIDSCRMTAVCGINGINYRSECEAWNGNYLHRNILTSLTDQKIFIN